jgi:predicted nucleotidyltransferase
MKDLEEIKKVLKNELPYLKEKYKVKKIGIFGSYVSGQNKKGSDIDILIEFKSDARIGLFEFIEINSYLSKLLNMRVDLVEKTGLKPFIGKNILREVKYL